jgi:hypothetical protein
MTERSRGYIALSAAVLIGVVVASYLIWYVLAGGPWWDSHESIWYPVRVVEYVEAWRAGAVYPRWCPDLYGGYGYPFFNFYAPGFYFVAGVFHVVGFSPVAACKAGIFVFTVIGAMSSYVLAARESGRRAVALLASVLFVVAPYRMCQILMRGDLAEYSALALAPFAIAGMRALLDENRNGQLLPRRLFAGAVLAHGAVWFAHTITGLCTTGILVLLVVGAAIRGPRRRAMIGAGALVLGLLLTAVYTLPAWVERGLVRIEELRSGIWHPTKNLVAMEFILSPGFFSIGWPAKIIAFLAPLALAFRAVMPSRARLLGWWLGGLALTSVMLGWSAPLWDTLPLVSFIQFPWRLLGFVSICAAVVLALMVARVVPATARLRMPILIVVALLVGGSELAAIGRPKPLDHPTLAALDSAHLRSKMYSSVVANEYLPRTVTSPPSAPRAYTIAASAPGIETHTRPSNPLTIDLRLTAHAQGVVDLALFAFPGWKMRVLSGDPRRLRQEISPTGLLRIAVLEPGDFHVVVAFALTPLRAVATTISLAVLLSLVGLLLHARWRQAKIGGERR